TSGTPVPGYRAKIVDDDGAELGTGETGNLWVSGDSCAAYYWNKHEKSKAAFKGDWYVTGDKYHLDADGYYTYEGRSDDMLKVSGQWVAPAEVEGALMDHPAAPARGGARPRTTRRASGAARPSRSRGFGSGIASWTGSRRPSVGTRAAFRTSRTTASTTMSRRDAGSASRSSPRTSAASAGR